MTRYNVRFDIDLTVEADTQDEAIQEALCDLAGCDYYMENEITEAIRRNADVEILDDIDY